MCSMRCSSRFRLTTSSALVALALVSCGKDTTASTDASTATATTATTATTSESTTTATTATTATTTATTIATVELTAADLVLRSDGIGPIDFDAPVADVLAQLIEVLGTPASDESTDYPQDNGGGEYQTADEFAFAHPFGRQVCFANGLCTSFGGTAPDDLTFVGWLMSNGEPPLLQTAAGVTVGARWADLIDTIKIDGGCMILGYSQLDGVDVRLESSGEVFQGFDEAGNLFEGTPDPADVTVNLLSAGDREYALFGDCA